MNIKYNKITILGPAGDFLNGFITGNFPFSVSASKNNEKRMDE